MILESLGAEGIRFTAVPPLQIRLGMKINVRNQNHPGMELTQPTGGGETTRPPLTTNTASPDDKNGKTTTLKMVMAITIPISRIQKPKTLRPPAGHQLIH